MTEDTHNFRRRDALAPLWLFGIVFGVQAVILRQIVAALGLFSPAGQARFLHSSWLTAGSAALIYSLIKMRPLLKSTRGDRFLYFLHPLVFVTMIGFGVLLLLTRE
jgi:hypothetical protein